MVAMLYEKDGIQQYRKADLVKIFLPPSLLRKVLTLTEYLMKINKSGKITGNVLEVWQMGLRGMVTRLVKLGSDAITDNEYKKWMRNPEKYREQIEDRCHVKGVIYN